MVVLGKGLQPLEELVEESLRVLGVEHQTVHSQAFGKVTRECRADSTDRFFQPLEQILSLFRGRHSIIKQVLQNLAPPSIRLAANQELP